MYLSLFCQINSPFLSAFADMLFPEKKSVLYLSLKIVLNKETTTFSLQTVVVSLLRIIATLLSLRPFVKNS